MSTNIGVTSILGTSLSLDQNSKYVQKAVCAATEKLVGAWLYCGADAGAAAVYKIIVHVNAAGIPGALTATSAELSVAAGSSFAWRYVAFTTTPTLTSGLYYFFGPHTADYRLNIKYASTGGINFGKADTYIGGASDPFGAGGGPGTRAYSCYLVTEPLNTAPNAPTITYPTGGETINPDVDQTFLETFSDNDAGDTQSALDHRYRVVGAAAWTTSGWISTPYGRRTIGGGTFIDGSDYEHQFQTKDALGLEGPWSASSLFSCLSGAGAVTITDPVVDQNITVSGYTVAWTISEMPSAQEVRIVADDGAGAPDTATVLEYSGPLPISQREHIVSFDVADGAVQHVQVRCKDADTSIWSDWATCRVNVDFTPPLTPLIVVTAVPGTLVAGVMTGGYISIQPYHQPPLSGEPTVTAVHIYRDNVDPDDPTAYKRIAKDLAPTAEYKDYMVASGVDYTYYVQAIGDNGTSSGSAPATSYVSPTDAEILLLA